MKVYIIFDKDASIIAGVFKNLEDAEKRFKEDKYGDDEACIVEKELE